jgi:hypothetical protein
MQGGPALTGRKMLALQLLHRDGGCHGYFPRLGVSLVTPVAQADWVDCQWLASNCEESLPEMPPEAGIHTPMRPLNISMQTRKCKGHPWSSY